ncbi:MAG: hypothetical protein ARM1_0569 [Candidatus Micrarchaeota archaeon]|nr:MAG: hypothetical protein ARM1_0569 [Candidatus Micrarchaeota archaeon]
MGLISKSYLELIEKRLANGSELNSYLKGNSYIKLVCISDNTFRQITLVYNSTILRPIGITPILNNPVSFADDIRS